jgi:hypothetical protein
MKLHILQSVKKSNMCFSKNENNFHFIIKICLVLNKCPFLFGCWSYINTVLFVGNI